MTVEILPILKCRVPVERTKENVQSVTHIYAVQVVEGEKGRICLPKSIIRPSFLSSTVATRDLGRVCVNRAASWANVQME